jgi:hypothetical protein
MFRHSARLHSFGTHLAKHRARRVEDMKPKLKKLIMAAVIIGIASFAFIHPANARTVETKYWPVLEFVGSNSALAQWYGDYTESLGAQASFKDFCRRLSTSDVFIQKLDGAGINYEDIEDSIATLSKQNWASQEFNDKQYYELRAEMLSLDIALSAIEARLSGDARNELRREVLRGANVIPEVVKAPAVQPTQIMGTLLGNKNVITMQGSEPIKDKQLISPQTITLPPRYDRFLSPWTW